MNVKDIKKYEGKLVLIELKNGYKFSAVIPKFKGSIFTITDKFNKKVSIDVSLVVMVYEKNE